VRTTCFWNNFHQVRSKSNVWKAKEFKVLKAIKAKGINRVVKIGYGHICLGILPHMMYTGWTTYVIHSGIIFFENLIMAEIVQPSDKIQFIFMLFQQRTCMIKARPKCPTDLYGTIYIDNIQRAVLICLIIPTIFPFDAGTSINKYPDV
jgi:hypothetical protein